MAADLTPATWIYLLNLSFPESIIHINTIRFSARRCYRPHDQNLTVSDKNIRVAFPTSGSRAFTFEQQINF
jgi:hypothetical protein